MISYLKCKWTSSTLNTRYNKSVKSALCLDFVILLLVSVISQSIKYFRIEEQEGTSVKMIVFHAFMLMSNQLGVFLDENEQLIACQNWFPVLSYPWVLKLLILTTMSNILLL